MNLLFDLDGTLTDPFEGISKCIQYALSKLDRPIPPSEELRWCIGPPLMQSFTKLLSSDDEKLSEKALALYRERFGRKGLYENKVYKDIPNLLKTLNEQGNSLFVATAKPTTYAKRIITHFGLSTYFKRIYGSELDGTRTVKSELIAYILKKEEIPPSRAVMIGDRKHDVWGAERNGLYCVGVLWGYGDRKELKMAGADRIITKPPDLISALKRVKMGLSPKNAASTD